MLPRLIIIDYVIELFGKHFPIYPLHAPNSSFFVSHRMQNNFFSDSLEFVVFILKEEPSSTFNQNNS